jgi:hypothetical protein
MATCGILICSEFGVVLDLCSNTTPNAPEKGVFVMCPHPMWYDTEEALESDGPVAGGPANQ